MRARPSPRSGCSRRSGSTTSTPGPTWSTSTWDGCGQSWARRRSGRCAARGTRSMAAEGVRGRLDWSLRQFGWLESVWVVFAVANLVAMWALPTWETVPFHFIWIRLTVVPLMAAVFLAMVWHARRRVVATERERQASEANRRLLERQRQFVQDASHELRTPITIAMGHADLLAREVRDPELAEDAVIVVDELLRLRRLADRLLLLASSADPDFLTTSPTEVHPLLAEARARWAPSERRFVVERGNAAVALADPERLGTAQDALIENAVKQTERGDEIRLGARCEDGRVVIAVADSGPGIAPDQLEPIFDRFARLDVGRSRDHGGVGLGLAIVKAIAEAHGGSIRVRSALGRGSVFEVLLPAPLAPLEAAAR